MSEPLTKKSRQRILKLADYMESLPPEKNKTFSMAQFFNGDAHIEKPGDCNTTACALGWACNVPQFRRAGLQLSRNYDNAVNYKEYSDFEAAQEFFELSNADVEYLFGCNVLNSNINLTPKKWAKRARAFVQRKDGETLRALTREANMAGKTLEAAEKKLEKFRASL